MATSYSEQDILQKYRDSIHNNRSQLESTLRKGQWQNALLKSGCLTAEEWASIEGESVGGFSEKKTNRANAILETIKRKDSYRCYVAFSKVLCDKDSTVGGKVFPFVKELKSQGLHAPLVPSQHGTQLTHSKEVNRPVIVWLLLSKGDYDSVSKVLQMGNVPSSERAGHHCQEFSLCEGSAALFLAYPVQSHDDGGNPFTGFLQSFTPRPQLAVMTSTCRPVRGNSTLTPGQVVLVTRRDPLSITGELEFTCELWRLRKELKVPAIAFGRATKWIEEVSCLIQCRDAVDFYQAAANVQDSLEYFAAVQVDGERSLSTQVDRNPLYQLMFELLKYFSDDRL